MTEADILKQLNSDFLQVFKGSPQGQRVYKHLSLFCLKNSCTFDKDSARKSDFNSGARAVILEIDDWLELDLTTLDKINEVENKEQEDE